MANELEQMREKIQEKSRKSTINMGKGKNDEGIKQNRTVSRERVKTEMPKNCETPNSFVY